MRLKAIRAHIAAGVRRDVGAVYEIPDRIGRELIGWGKAVADPLPRAPKKTASAKRQPPMISAALETNDHVDQH